MWVHTVCGCEAAKFSKMPLKMAYGREMTITFRGTLPPCCVIKHAHFRVVLSRGQPEVHLCNKSAVDVAS